MHHHPQNQERALNLSILIVSGIRGFTTVKPTRDDLLSERVVAPSASVSRTCSEGPQFPAGLARTLSRGGLTALPSPPLSARCSGSAQPELATGLACRGSLQV